MSEKATIQSDSFLIQCDSPPQNLHFAPPAQPFAQMIQAQQQTNNGQHKRVAKVTTPKNATPKNSSRGELEVLFHSLTDAGRAAIAGRLVGESAIEALALDEIKTMSDQDAAYWLKYILELEQSERVTSWTQAHEIAPYLESKITHTLPDIKDIRSTLGKWSSDLLGRLPNLTKAYKIARQLEETLHSAVDELVQVATTHPQLLPGELGRAEGEQHVDSELLQYLHSTFPLLEGMHLQGDKSLLLRYLHTLLVSSYDAHTAAPNRHNDGAMRQAFVLLRNYHEGGYNLYGFSVWVAGAYQLLEQEKPNVFRNGRLETIKHVFEYLEGIKGINNASKARKGGGVQ